MWCVDLSVTCSSSTASARLGGAALTLEGARIPHHKFKCHARFCSSSNLAGSFVGPESWRQCEKGQRQISTVNEAPCGYCQLNLNALVDVFVPFSFRANEPGREQPISGMIALGITRNPNPFRIDLRQSRSPQIVQAQNTSSSWVVATCFGRKKEAEMVRFCEILWATRNVRRCTSIYGAVGYDARPADWSRTRLTSWVDLELIKSQLDFEKTYVLESWFGIRIGNDVFRLISWR